MLYWETDNVAFTPQGCSLAWLYQKVR